MASGGDAEVPGLPGSSDEPASLPDLDNEQGVVSEEEGDFTEFIRDILDKDLDHSRGSGLPVVATETVTVGSTSIGDAKIGLPTEAVLGATGIRRGNAEVVYDSNRDLEVEVAAIDGNGIRFVTVIDGPNAPLTYTYSFEIPSGVRLKTKPDLGNALLVIDGEDGLDKPVGYIDVPWAYDANGNSVPVSQVITSTSITLTINHRNAAYPVYADPSYYSLSCTFGYSELYSAANYLRTYGVCPATSFYSSQGYWPVGTRSLANSHRSVEKQGECSWYSDTGAYWDFQVACKGHDYCYDLIRANYSQVTKRRCDQLFLEDLETSCGQYGWLDWRRYPCFLEIPFVNAGVYWLGAP
ncbi:MAG: hypothetical protein OXG34_05030 [bacterium]|nr:hypothetical protein [bacterium]